MSRLRIAAGVAGLAVLIACSDSALTNPSAPALKKADDSTPINSDMIDLGTAIFFDESLSLNGNQSCASCHDPEWGFTGPDSDVNAAGAVYEGSVADQFGNRRPPSAAYATVSPIFHHDGKLFVGGNFWDGRATGEKLGNPAADQAQGPFLNPAEQALSTPSDVVTLVCGGSYSDLFKSVWGSEICDPANVDAAYDDIALSIAAYEDSPEVNAFTSKYDAHLAGMAELTKKEKRGLSLFRGKAKCSKCHVLGTGRGKDPALFTDFTFDNLGVPRNPENPVYVGSPGFVDQGLGGFLATRPEYAALEADHLGMHKVPTLRNVDRRPSTENVKAFGHNGYFKSLWQIVHFYNTRDTKPLCQGDFSASEAIANDCWPTPEVVATVNTAELGHLKLTHEQEMALVAFMRTLSDGYFEP